MIAAVSFGPHGLKVMSSMAISLPIPPGALLRMRSTTSDRLAGVVKKKPYCFHWGDVVTGISPVKYDCNTAPVVVSMVNSRFGLILVYFIMLSSQAANS